MLRLVKPSKKYLKSFLHVIDDYKKDKNHFGRGGIDPLIKAIDENKIDEYLKQLSDYEHAKKLPESWVPETRFWLLDDDNFVGSFSIRHALTPHLEQIGGHIAANISPKYRGKYSSFIGVKLCFLQSGQPMLFSLMYCCICSFVIVSGSTEPFVNSLIKLSALNLALHSLQSISGSEKDAKCPLASQTFGFIKIAQSTPCEFSLSRINLFHQIRLMLFLSSTPNGP